MKTILGLCKGRHEMPVDKYIFEENITDPTDVCSLEKQAAEVLPQSGSVIICVTGLTVALIAALNVCRTRGVQVVLMHYNNATGEYYAQLVV